MQILIYAEVEVCAEAEDFDFTHSSKHYRFTDRKMANAYEDAEFSHADRIDNDYTGDPEPYFACVYFGTYDTMSFEYDDDYVEHDTEIIFAKESFEDKEPDTKIVSDNVDMFELKEAFEWQDTIHLWLWLKNIFGVEYVENEAQLCTSGNAICITEKEAEQYLKESEEFLRENTSYFTI